jgi:hypothetical protein
MRISGKYFKIYGEDRDGYYEYIIKGVYNEGTHGKYLYVRGRVISVTNLNNVVVGKTYTFCVSPKRTDFKEIRKEDIYLYLL